MFREEFLRIYNTPVVSGPYLPVLSCGKSSEDPQRPSTDHRADAFVAAEGLGKSF